jgi:hypothetical protein
LPRPTPNQMVRGVQPKRLIQQCKRHGLAASLPTQVRESDLRRYPINVWAETALAGAIIGVCGFAVNGFLKKTALGAPLSSVSAGFVSEIGRTQRAPMPLLRVRVPRAHKAVTMQKTFNAKTQRGKGAEVWNVLVAALGRHRLVNGRDRSPHSHRVLPTLRLCSLAP